MSNQPGCAPPATTRARPSAVKMPPQRQPWFPVGLEHRRQPKTASTGRARVAAAQGPPKPGAPATRTTLASRASLAPRPSPGAGTAVPARSSLPSRVIPPARGPPRAPPPRASVLPQTSLASRPRTASFSLGSGRPTQCSVPSAPPPASKGSTRRSSVQEEWFPFGQDRRTTQARPSVRASMANQSLRTGGPSQDVQGCEPPPASDFAPDAPMTRHETSYDRRPIAPLTESALAALNQEVAPTCGPSFVPNEGPMEIDPMDVSYASYRSEDYEDHQPQAASTPKVFGLRHFNRDRFQRPGSGNQTLGKIYTDDDLENYGDPQACSTPQPHAAQLTNPYWWLKPPSSDHPIQLLQGDAFTEEGIEDYEYVDDNSYFDSFMAEHYDQPSTCNQPISYEGSNDLGDVEEDEPGGWMLGGGAGAQLPGWAHRGATGMVAVEGDESVEASREGELGLEALDRLNVGDWGFHTAQDWDEGPSESC